MSTPVSGMASKPVIPSSLTPVVPQNLAENKELTGAQVQFLSQQGFLTLDAITTREEIREIRSALQELFDKKAGENEGANLDFVAGDHPEAPKTAPPIINAGNSFSK